MPDAAHIGIRLSQKDSLWIAEKIKMGANLAISGQKQRSNPHRRYLL
jgi:hypothetical protein